MMVSIATVVLPVLRSPTINCRWPRPSGIIASITVMPVSSGSVTRSRSTMPGAGRSIGSNRSALISGPPSIGAPMAETTRPNNASPTGTRATAPVPVTVLPAEMPEPPDSSTQPWVVSLTLSATPMVPSAKRTSSSSRVCGRPEIVATPSPTTSTRPVRSRSGVTSAASTRVLAVFSQSCAASFIVAIGSTLSNP